MPTLHELSRADARRIAVRAQLLAKERPSDLIETVRLAIEEAGIERVIIRSVLTCQTRRGICAQFYGRDLARAQRL